MNEETSPPSNIVGITKPGARAGRWLYPGLIAAAVAGATLNTWSGPFIFDDVPRILESNQIRRLWPPSAVCAGSTRPLLHYSLAVNYAVSGLQVWSYHALNILVHLAAALALFGTVRRVLNHWVCPQCDPRIACHLALVCALLWAVHPLQTQCVNYVIQRAESMASLFYLVTLYSVIRGLQSPRHGWFVAAVVCCALGLGCKEMVITAPLVVLLFDRAFETRSLAGSLRRRWALYAGLWGTALIPVALWLFNTTTTIRQTYIEPPADWSLLYALNQPTVILYYLRLAIWPEPLCMDYNWPLDRTIRGIIVPLMIVGAMLLITAWLCWRRPRLGFLPACFFLILAPSSSILPLPDLVFEYRMYLPLAAVVAAVVLSGHALVTRLVADQRSRALASGAIVFVVVACAITATWRRNRDYRGAESIWRDVIAKRPDNPRGYNNLGEALLRSGELGEALQQFRQAAEIKPDFAKALYNIGIVLLRLGENGEAEPFFRRAIELNPQSGVAHFNLGNALAALGRLQEATNCYREALNIHPHHARAHANLGNALAQLGQPDQAVVHFREALRIAPGSAFTHYNLALTLAQLDNIQEAVHHYRQAIAIKPDFAQARERLREALSKQAQQSAKPPPTSFD